MPVYHFTWHAHGTWRPDNGRGYVERGEGILPPDPQEAERRDRNQKNDRVEFDAPMQGVLIAGAYDCCVRRGWRLHAGGTDPTHVHLLTSWREYVEWSAVRDRLKNLLSLFLGRLKQRPGGNWFVDNGSRKRVTRREHFDYLVNSYFPDHRGLFWKEGLPLPQIDPRILDPGASASGYHEDPG